MFFLYQLSWIVRDNGQLNSLLLLLLLLLFVSRTSLPSEIS